MSAVARNPLLGPVSLNRLPEAVQRPAYDRTRLRVGMAHIGVGAFHRCHQAEYTDDLLAKHFDRWGVVGINIRSPDLAGTLGRQAGLYTRLIRENDRAEARVIGSIVSVVDSQASPEPALEVLASSDIDVVTLTITEKGYCHRPASGDLDTAHPDIVHDLSNPHAPRSVPGLIARALELRMSTHGRPLTLVSCDNIPGNGALLQNVVQSITHRRGNGLEDWIAANAAFPSTMVDRIAPATSQADFETVERGFGYRDRAVVTGEPFRQWVLENRFAGRFPRWDEVGVTFVDDVTPFEHLKMRVLNGAQTTLSYLGVLAGHEHTCDDMKDPLLVGFVRRMLLEESLPTLGPVPGISPEAYVEQSLERLRNTAIRHRNHQIATDGSQKIVQRLLNPILERLRRGEAVRLLTLPVAAWMVYLVKASDRFGRQWTVDDPHAARIAAIADRVGSDAPALVREILSIDAIFDRELSANAAFRQAVVAHLEGLLEDPMGHLRHVCGLPLAAQLNHATHTA
ncbi:mannitol dehydrogenase family protein [Arvimicrobium flavum]|uniref:mannitol dehydrogenase family protein n=1 Tax=Arvimicrobium flavum TaxID=3393320 RepID=UPI00237B3CBE|nr:mannitol dehydrogenase family protein [Mesorhizobium shangrilense]